MTSGKLRKLAVSPGYKCNFKCGHCCNLAGVPGIDEFDAGTLSLSGAASEITAFMPGGSPVKAGGRIFDFCQPGGMTEKEALAVAAAIRGYGVRLLQFTGGETTFYLRDINRILQKAGDLSRCCVAVTTNGHFAATAGAAMKVLGSVSKLDIVQLSYDKFHAEFLPFFKVRNLIEACGRLGKLLTVNISLQSPADLLLVNKLKAAGIKDVTYQKIIPVGAAKINKVSFPALAFDKKVLAKKCPGINSIIYLCGRGFANCCITLALSGKYPGMYHPTVGKLMRSRVYRLMSGNTFGQIMKKFGLPSAELRAEHSYECVLCEHIFKNRPEYLA